MLCSFIRTKGHQKVAHEASAALLKVLKDRFEQNMHRHEGLEWGNVQSRLEEDHSKLWSLSEMERTGGEPDVVGHDETTGEYIVYDCAAESPNGRRSVCYDHQALEARKKYPPKDSAEGMAADMGITMLTEEQYRSLQELEPIHMKTSSWVKTPEKIRALGGALFCDRRFDHVFTYHNGAESYYGARGFRGVLRV